MRYAAAYVCKHIPCISIIMVVQSFIHVLQANHLKGKIFKTGFTLTIRLETDGAHGPTVYAFYRHDMQRIITHQMHAGQGAACMAVMYTHALKNLNTFVI